MGNSDGGFFRLSTLRAIPVSLRHFGKGRNQTEHVVPTVTSVAQKHLFVVFCIVTHLALKHRHVHALIRAVPWIGVRIGRPWDQARDVVPSFTAATYNHGCRAGSLGAFLVINSDLECCETQVACATTVGLLWDVRSVPPSLHEVGADLTRVLRAAHEARYSREVWPIHAKQLLEDCCLFSAPLSWAEDFFHSLPQRYLLHGWCGCLGLYGVV